MHFRTDTCAKTLAFIPGAQEHSTGYWDQKKLTSKHFIDLKHAHMADFRRKKSLFWWIERECWKQNNRRNQTLGSLFFFFFLPPLELLDFRPSEGGPLVDAEESWTEQSAWADQRRCTCVYLMNGCNTEHIQQLLTRLLKGDDSSVLLYLPLRRRRPERRRAHSAFPLPLRSFGAVCWRRNGTEPLHIRYKTITISHIKDKFIHMYAHMLTSDTYFTVCVCALV